jgi:hypothetical protein
VLDALDADGGDGGAFDGAEQNTAQAVADGGAEAALERLRRKHAIPLGESFGIGDKTLRFLESFEHDENLFGRQKSEARSQNGEPEAPAARR